MHVHVIPQELESAETLEYSLSILKVLIQYHLRLFRYFDSVILLFYFFSTIFNSLLNNEEQLTHSFNYLLYHEYNI